MGMKTLPVLPVAARDERSAIMALQPSFEGRTSNVIFPTITELLMLKLDPGDGDRRC